MNYEPLHTIADPVTNNQQPVTCNQCRYRSTHRPHIYRDYFYITGTP